MAYKDPNKAKAYNKAWREAHKEIVKANNKVWNSINKEYMSVYQKEYNKVHKQERNAYGREYIKSDLNSLGQTKQSIRCKSRYYLKKYGKKIEGYEIHHCCSYDDYSKFIYCNKEMHKLIHSYLRQHNIDADSNHYKYIKHLLDDTVIKYNVE